MSKRRFLLDNHIPFLIIIGLILKVDCDVSEFFDGILTIEAVGGNGPFNNGEKSQFICTARNIPTIKNNTTMDYHLEWLLGDGEGYFHSVHFDEFSDDLVSRNGQQWLVRKSNISFIGADIKSLACRLSLENGNGETFKKIIPLTIHPQNEDEGLRILMEVYSGGGFPPSSPLDVTNQSIILSRDVMSFKLFCAYNKYNGSTELTHGQQWSIHYPSSHPQQSSPSQFLNNIALVQKLASSTDRLPPLLTEEHCSHSQKNNGSTSTMIRNNGGEWGKMLQVLVPPPILLGMGEGVVGEGRISIYICKGHGGHGGSSNVSIQLPEAIGGNGTRKSKEDEEFLELIHAIMQLLNNGGGGGEGGNGPLYGVGFGSTTIMILMALIIYYLRRRLQQLQDQVAEHDAAEQDALRLRVRRRTNSSTALRNSKNKDEEEEELETSL